MARYLDQLGLSSFSSFFGRVTREYRRVAIEEPEKKKNLANDQRGAILMMGLFMGLSLAGSLWFILGIGDAIIIRDKAIEASDHAAFSAATVHARGMNYIAALNLIMFALTIIYVGICIVADIIINLANLGGWTQYDIPLIGEVCFINPLIVVTWELASVAEPACKLGHKIADAAVSYAGVLSTVFKGIGVLEDVIQVGMPIAGEAAAMTVISNYQPYTGFALSPAFIPIESISSSDGPAHFGMPMKPEKDSYLCERAFNKVQGLVSKFSVPLVSHLVNMVIGLVEGYVMNTKPEDTWRGVGCKGGNPWSHTDVHVMHDKAKNGEDMFQIYSFVINAEDKEDAAQHDSERKISLSKNKANATEFNKPKKRIYFSQAEYYFDCTKDWKNVECYDKDERNASFSMAWRARLRRVYGPSFGNKFIGYATRFAASGSPDNFLYGLLGDMPIAKKMTDAIMKIRHGGLSGPITGTDLGNSLDDIAHITSGGDKLYH